MPAVAHAIPVGEVCRRLATDPETGLSPTEAAARLQQYGPNQLPEAAGRSMWAMAVDQIKEPLVLVLIAAAVISVVLREFTDAVVILAIVVLNTVLGVSQESRAEHALAALKELARPMARVLRGGHLREVPAAELVPGDIVFVEAGSRIPADLRLIEAPNLQVDEAPLTGESVPVAKRAGPDLVVDPAAPVADRVNMAYMGTVATYGRGRGVVSGTGSATEIGRIASLLQGGEPESTPLQRRLAELGKVLGAIALGVVVVVFLVGLWRGEHLLEMFMTAISLAVAAIPEGLPAIVTIVLALGVQRMAARHAIIRRLPAVETLGAATVIASDKTGTITQNRMTCVEAWVDGQTHDLAGMPDDVSPNLAWLLRGGALVNDGRLEQMEPGEGGGQDGERTPGVVLRRDGRELRVQTVGDPTETALLVAAARAGWWPDDLNHAFPRVAEVPFDSVRKRMATVHRNGGDARPGGASGAEGDGRPAAASAGHGHAAWPAPEALAQAPYLAFVKGSPESVLGRCTRILRGGVVGPLTDAAREQVLQANAGMAGRALRVLAVAVRPLEAVPDEPSEAKLEQDLVMVGLVGLIDPPRAEVAEAVQVSRAAGVRPIMITGDHRDTAAAIARQIGLLTGRTLTGVELDQMNDQELAEQVDVVDVYARVSPEHKLRIVEALKARGHVVAVTGDGVNDAPALQRADIGAAMGITGTDVAKGAADMVLADDNFATVVAAVAEGRTIFANIKKFVHYLLSCNIGEIVAIFGAILLGLGRPLTAIQILWVNLVTDGLPALALGVEPREPGIMERPPRRRDEGVFSGGLAWRIGYQGLMLGGLTLMVYAWVLSEGFGPERARTAAFITLSLSQLFHAFNVRSAEQSLVRVGLFSNRAMLGAFLASAALQFMVIFWGPLASVFEITPLSGAEWTVVLVASVAPIPLVELVKLLRRLA